MDVTKKGAEDEMGDAYNVGSELLIKKIVRKLCEGLAPLLLRGGRQAGVGDKVVQEEQ